jgi:Ca2+-binding EF-hand superfamily protein
MVEKKDPAVAGMEKEQEPERIAILTPGGPLVMEVRLTLDGHRNDEGVQAEIKTVLDAADTDHDGRATWKELLDNAEYLKTGSPEAPELTARQKKMYLDQYDLDSDGYVSRDEAASWAGRSTGRKAKAFDVRSTRAFAPDPRATSRLWALFDADRNGALSVDEVRSAPASLLRLDEDDDEVITEAELTPLEAQLAANNAQRSASGRNDSHYAALRLEPKTDVARIEYLLNDLYSPRQDLTPGSFSAFPRLAEKLDANSDNWLDREELAELLKTDAYLGVTVAFSAADGSQPAAGKLHLDSQAPVVSVIGDAKSDKAVVSVGGARLILAAADLSPTQAGGAAPQAYGAVDRNQIRLMIHDQVDALFNELDANADGRLGAREIAVSADRLLAHDADRNGELTAEELPYVMIAAFMRSEPGNEDSYYIPPMKPAATTGDVAPAWFRHADFNSDGDISRREFLGSTEQFSKLDANRDGFIEPQEAAAAGSP